ncbi:hypothetical protein RvY_12605 [Ramazzottius varieornatus]|uniref:BED-type domain-containing protein n=1 Tax=Ramazzottius varieornatus TaxID=947166 RepID=A0A1D1VP97_RAMVA|nr:hypothetical protein RvY_12605 [Ramazzottius varieornatus]
MQAVLQELYYRKGAKKKLPPERGKAPVAAAIAASPPVIDIAETDDGSDSEDESSRPHSTSSSSRFSQKRKQPGGQKKASAVWQYYTEDAETDTSTCKSCNHEAKPAGNTGNAVSHLKNRHPDGFAKYEEQEKLRKDLEKKKKQDKPATGIAMILSKLKFESSNPYEQGSLRYRTILRERALWVLRTTATPSLCANLATQRAFVKHDPRSPAFGR